MPPTSSPRSLPWAIATFFGFLWVLGLTEEFFFRGVLQRWIEDWIWNPTAALLITAILFGLVHYWFGGWPWVPMAAGVSDWFCGRARNQAGSIRASVVTHALGGDNLACVPCVAVKSSFYGKTRISGTRSDGLSHGSQSAPRRTSGGALVEHLRKGAQTGGRRERPGLRYTRRRWRETPIAFSSASAIPPWRKR